MADDEWKDEDFEWPPDDEAPEPDLAAELLLLALLTPYEPRPTRMFRVPCTNRSWINTDKNE